MTGQTPDGYSTRQAAYDLRQLRGQQLITKPAAPAATTSHVPGDVARTITAILAIRDHAIAPLIARVRTPTHWTNIDRDYETLRLSMQTLFGHLGLGTDAAP